MAKSIRCILIILSVAIVLSPNSPAQADDTDYKIVAPNDIPKVLSMLASVTKANFEKIKTWEGRINSETMYTIRGERAAENLKTFTDAEPNDSLNEIQQIFKGAIEFKIDVKNDQFFSFMDYTGPPIYLDPKNNKAYPPSQWHPEETTFIATPEHRIEISPLIWEKNDSISRRIAIKEQARAPLRIDPRKVYYAGEPLWEKLSRLPQLIQIPSIEKFGVVIKKKSVGDNITYRIEISKPGEDRPFQILILSSEAGFNSIYAENRYDDGPSRTETTTEFINLQGVFLPNKWRISQYYPDGGLKLYEDFTMEHQQINMPIPVSTFSELTYLHDGDILRDKIANKDFEYKDGKLIEAEKKSEVNK